MIVVLGLVVETPLVARSQAFCDDGQELAPGTAFSALQTVLAEVIGEPVECEHAGPRGDLLQLTSTGLAFIEASSDTPNFTNGAEHWALVNGDLAYWIDVAAEAPAPPAVPPDQPADQPAVGLPAPPMTPAAPVPGLVLLPWQDTTGDPGRPYLFFAKSRCTYAAEAFERTSSSAGVVITYSPNLDDPLDKPNQVRLMLDWPGVATSRTVAGAVAIAQVGGASVHWTSYNDRLVQDVLFPVRPTAAHLDQQLNGHAITTSRDSAGGYLATDTASVARFFVRVPTVVDAGGQTRRAALTWNFPSASIALDPIFLSSATYPVTVSLTVEFGTAFC